jgi:hypothetical protein
MTCRTNPANPPTRQGHAVAANSPNNQVNTCSLPLFTSSLFHSFTGFCSLSTVHSLPSVFCRLLTAQCDSHHGEQKFPHFRGAIQ